MTGKRPVESVQRTLTDGLVSPRSSTRLFHLPFSVILKALEIDPENAFRSALNSNMRWKLRWAAARFDQSNFEKPIG
jgi:hypothetical protein